MITHFAASADANGGDLERRVRRVAARFEERIEDAYFRPDTPVRPIDAGLHAWLATLRAGGMRVALDTGYPPAVQAGLAEMLEMGPGDAVDALVSAYDVAEGRPYPYMIFRAMEACGVRDVRRVAKVGDSARDMEEGRNAGCGLVVGVLSGADPAATLFAGGADVVVPIITDLEVGQSAEEDVYQVEKSASVPRSAEFKSLEIM